MQALAQKFLSRILMACGCAGKDSRFGVDNVGTPAASLTAFLAAQAFQPDLAISLGTAGGFKTKGAAIGAVFVGTGTMNHDRRIPIPVSPCI